MSLSSISKFLTNNTLWIIFSTILMTLYLSPLFYDVFYVPTFDNLDSNVVWFKILAESGMIFANNDAIIPNMMNGLPRSSYGSEFNIILWLYYFFEPRTAFIINEVAIHFVAFFSMYIFLNKYIVKQNTYYGNVPIFVGALYFALLPFWSGAGLSIAILPLVTYSLLNIKNNDSTKWDWLLLLFLPLYSSFIFLYMFYIILSGIYMLWDTLKNRKLNKPFFFALFLMGTSFLLSEYRLIIAMFFDSGFISHRTEFDIFFNENLFESYRLALVNFSIGHEPHAISLQGYYVLPAVLIALILSLFTKNLNSHESLMIWILILFSFIVNIWEIILIHKYTLPGITLFLLYLILFRKKNYHISLFLLLTIILSVIAAAFQFEGFKWISKAFPIFQTLNMIRILFVQPLLWTILLTLSLILITRKLQYSTIFILLFILLQFSTSYSKSFYQTNSKQGYASFQDYYAPDIFDKLKNEIVSMDNNSQAKFVSYGMEPAVALFNGLHTIDGYSTNYPLNYKHEFKKVFSSYSYNELFDKWGSKVYIPTIASQLDTYYKGLKLKKLRFKPIELCKLHTDYIISPYLFEDPTFNEFELIQVFKGTETSWDIYLYKLYCK